MQASGLSPDLTRPMIRRLEVADRARQEGQGRVRAEDGRQDSFATEIELKRLRILEADKAKKAKMKDLMDKAMAAYAEGKYVECEALAKRAMEIDPNELAASILVYKAKMERRFKADKQNHRRQGERHRHGVPGSRRGVDHGPRSPASRHRVCRRTSRT